MIDQQLRRHLDAAAPPLTLTEVLAGEPLIEIRPRDIPRRRWPLVAASLATAAATLAALALIIVHDSDRTQSAVPTEQIKPLPPSATWRPIPDSNAAFEASRTGVAGTRPSNSVSVAQTIPYGSGYLAVGTTSIGTIDTATVWTSPNGITWAVVPPSPEFASTAIASADHSAGTSLNSVAANGSTVVAVGYTQEAAMSAAVWTSRDGTTWHRSTLDLSANPRAHITGVIATDTGFLAYGTDGTDDAAGANATATAWTSTDGTVWGRVALEGLTTKGAHIDGITRSLNGYIAFGSTGDFSAGQATVWVSDDSATTWTPTSLPQASRLAHSEASTVIAAAGGLVAIGSAYSAPSTELHETLPASISGDEDVIAWESSDGNNWTQIDTSLLNTTTSLDQFTAAASGPAGIIITLTRETPTAYEGEFAQIIDGAVTSVLTGPVVGVSTLTPIDGGYLATTHPVPALTTSALNNFMEHPRDTSLWILPTGT